MNHLYRWSLLRSAAACVLAVVLPAGAARAGVIAHWSFDAPDADGTYEDSVNNAHPATPADKSAVHIYSGADGAHFGNAVTFLGPSSPNSYLTIPPLTNIQTRSFTVAVWVNLASPESGFVLTDYPSGAEAGFAFGFHPFDSSRNTAQPMANLISAETAALGRARGGFAGRSGGSRLSVVRQALANKAVPLNEWHHVAWAWDRENQTMKFYYDGELWGETKRTANAGFSRGLDMVVTNHRARIGSQELSVAGNRPAVLNGSLDELWIFDEELTVIQLRNLIKTNDIRSGGITPVAGGGATTPGTATTGAVTSVVPDRPPVTATAMTPLPGRSVASTADRPSPVRVAGILTCLVVIVSTSCYLLWALIERSRLRAAGHLR